MRAEARELEAGDDDIAFKDDVGRHWDSKV